MDNEIVLPIQMRAMPVNPTSVDAESRTVEIIFTSGAPVQRYSWRSGENYTEELVVTPEAVDLTRLNNGAPVLDTHSSYELENIIAGVVPGSARIEGGKGYCRIQFLEKGIDEETDVLFEKIRKGIIRNVSVGYRYIEITEIRIEGKLTVRVDRWEPMEVSLVPVPADAECVVRSEGGARREFTAIIQRSGDEAMTQQQDKGTQTQPATETTEQRAAVIGEARAAGVEAGRTEARAEVSEILDLAEISKASISDVRGWLKDGKKPAEIRSAILEKNATEAESTATRGAHTISTDSANANALAENMRGLVNKGAK